MGCSEGRQKPQKIEVKPVRRTRSAPTRILQITACLPFVATLHTSDGAPTFLALWETSDTDQFHTTKTYSPPSSDSGESVKAITSLSLDSLESCECRLLFAACVYMTSGPPSSRENEPRVCSLIRIWDLKSGFDRPEELREFAPGEELHAIAAGEECLTAVSAAWLYVWNCRMTVGGRKSVYRNPVFTLSFQMSLGQLPSPSVLSIQSIEGIHHTDIREKSRLCVCAGIRREPSPPVTRQAVPYAVILTQEESEVAHKVQVVDLKANVSKEFTLASTRVSACRLLPDSECLAGVYTERYHCEIWRVTLTGVILARVSFQTSSKRLSLNPLEKFMSEKSAQMASPSRKGKFSSPIIEMMVGAGSKGPALTVICADGYIARYSTEGFKCEAEFRVNLMCDVAAFCPQCILIGDKTGYIHRVACPGKL